MHGSSWGRGFPCEMLTSSLGWLAPHRTELSQVWESFFCTEVFKLAYTGRRTFKFVFFMHARDLMCKEREDQRSRQAELLAWCLALDSSFLAKLSRQIWPPTSCCSGALSCKCYNRDPGFLWKIDIFQYFSVRNLMAIEPFRMATFSTEAACCADDVSRPGGWVGV